MRTLGLIGGVSWESTREYYRMLNEGVRDAMGGLHSAKIVMHSLDFGEIAAHQHAGEWDKLHEITADAAEGLQNAGASAIMICSNLMHKMAPAAEAHCSIPLLHIADASAAAIKANGQTKVGLLGASFTMNESFYKDRLASHGIDVIIPQEEDAAEVSRVIYEELCTGQFLESSRDHYLKTIERLGERGAQGVVLGCTEIPLLVSQEQSSLPIYDTTTLHVQMGLDWMLEQKEELLASA